MSNCDIVYVQLLNNIFIASTSCELYGEMYASIIDQLRTSVPELNINTFMNTYIDNYIKDFHNIPDISPVDNYDEYCRVVKQHDIRKNTSILITWLYKKNVITIEHLFNLITTLLNTIQTYIYESNVINDVEVMTENIYLLIIHTHSRISRSDKEDQWFDVTMPKIYDIANTTAQKKDLLKSSNDRIMFKFKQLVEVIEA